CVGSGVCEPEVAALRAAPRHGRTEARKEDVEATGRRGRTQRPTHAKALSEAQPSSLAAFRAARRGRGVAWRVRQAASAAWQSRIQTWKSVGFPSDQRRNQTDPKVSAICAFCSWSAKRARAAR